MFSPRCQGPPACLSTAVCHHWMLAFLEWDAGEDHRLCPPCSRCLRSVELLNWPQEVWKSLASVCLVTTWAQILIIWPSNWHMMGRMWPNVKVFISHSLNVSRCSYADSYPPNQACCSTVYDQLGEMWRYLLWLCFLLHFITDTSWVININLKSLPLSVLRISRENKEKALHCSKTFPANMLL